MAKTFLAAVNDLADLVGERRIADGTEFAAEATLPKVLLQAKKWYALNHTWAMVTPRARFLLRDYTITTSNGVNSYNLNAATNYERVLEDSMFNTTSGAEFGPIQYVDLMEYRTQFPRDNEAVGRPTRYFHKHRTAAVGPDAIGFSAPPDATYTIQYSAFLKPYQLSAATDQICVDAEWEHIFLLGATVFLEILKSEGKGGDFQGYAQQMKDEFEQHTVPVAGEHLRLDPTCGGALNIWGRRGSADIWNW